MVALKRDTTELLLGIGVLALGLIILLFVFSQAFALAQNPGTFFRNQMNQVLPQTKAPTADFNYSGFDLNVSFVDTSTQGGAPIMSWDWNFGDGGSSTQRNPTHRFSGYGPWEVSLVVRDANGESARTFAQFTLAPQHPVSGIALGNPLGGSGGISVNLDIGTFLLPVGVGLLTVGMYLVMALIGGQIAKAGWNMIKPKPETIRVRLKPRDLTQAFEADTQPGTIQQGVPPPPQS